MRRGLALWLVLFAAYAATIGIDAGRGERFTPREVHVLLTAESVVSDGFVDLRDEYDAREWRRFTDTPVHTTGTTVHGRLLEPQGAGLALLIAPAYALGGPTAVELFLAALLALAYAKERRAFGQPISRFQAIQAKLADMATEIEAARLLTYKAAFLKDQGRNFTLTAAQAKLKTGRLAVRATEEAVQIHGGYGYIEEYPVCRFYRDAKILTIGEGTDEVQQMVIARALGA